MQRIINTVLTPEHSRRTYGVAAALLALLTLGMYADVLFVPGDTVLSAEEFDVHNYFAPALAFGFREVKQGNLPLWNPHVFSGTPFVGNFQSAMFYPVNYVHLFLPLAKGINVTFVIHTFLMGFFTYLWLAHKKARPMSCFFGAVLMMFSSAYFLHLQAGHLTLFATVTWMPLILWVVDKFIDSRHWPWVLLGIFAIAMHILAGYPPAVFATGFVTGVYALGRLVFAKGRIVIVPGLAAMSVGGLLIAAVQIGPGIFTAGESLRVAGLTYEFASSFSLPPESLITLLAPRFFGDELFIAYWGRWLPWETIFFVGVTGLALAGYGAVGATGFYRWTSVGIVLLLVVLALGRYAPVFQIFYEYVPGFSSFRSPSKLIIQATFFLVLLAVLGLERLIRRRQAAWNFIAVVGGLSVLLFVAGLVVQNVSPFSTFWRPTTDEELSAFMNEVALRFEERTYYVPYFFDLYESTIAPVLEPFTERSTRFAALSLYRAGAAALVLMLALLATRKWRAALVAVGLIGIVEIAAFSRISRPTFDLDAIRNPSLAEYYETHPGDYRVFEILHRNHPLLAGAKNIWGYDPVMLYRYAEFLAYTQWDQDKPYPKQNVFREQNVRFTRYDPLFRLIRCSRLVVETKRRTWIENRFDEEEHLPHLLFVTDWELMDHPDRIFQRLDSDAFDPWQTVILETPPVPEPNTPDAMREARIIERDTDTLVIEAELEAPGILLVTDSYSAGWRVVPLVPSNQDRYRVYPANYFLRAIPLAAGEHLFRLEYSPWAYRMGVRVTRGALTGYAVLVIAYGIWGLVERRQKRKTAESAE